MSIIEDEEKLARELLDKMNNNEQVSRWDVFCEQRIMRAIIRDEPDKYGELEYQFEDLVDSAKESL